MLIHELALRPLLGSQMADYCGRCRAELWRDSWGAGRVRMLGLTKARADGNLLVLLW